MAMDTVSSAPAAGEQADGGAQGEVPADVAAIREARARWETSQRG